MGLFRVTPRAKEELFALCAHPDHTGKGVRVFIEGMPHEEKTCWILMEDQTRPVDRIVVEDGLTFIVGPESAWYLKGKELDFDPADGEGSFYITPVPGWAEGWDSDEWAYLDDLPAEDEPWDDDDWELVAEDETEADEVADRRPEGGRLPRGWRPGP